MRFRGGVSVNRRWPVVVASVFAVLVMLGSVGASAGINSFPGQPVAAKSSPVASATAVSPAVHSAGCWVFCLPLVCYTPIIGTYLLLTNGPQCGGSSAPPAISPVNAANANITATNLIAAFSSEENEAAAAEANINGTFQELLSYYESRAESIAQNYVTQKWNNTTYAEILDESGLVPSIEGLEIGEAEQQYQIWNATAAEWNDAFGVGGAFATYDYAALTVAPGPGPLGPGGTYTNTGSEQFVGDQTLHGHGFNASFPWEYWTEYRPPGSYPFGFVNGSYFNIMPGGTIISAASCGLLSYLCTQSEGNFTIQDLTTGHNYSVPDVNWTTFNALRPGGSAGSVLNDTLADHIGAFDTLRLWCSTNCSNNNATVETTGAYFTEGVRWNSFANQTVLSNTWYLDTGTAETELISGKNGGGGTFGSAINGLRVPQIGEYVCTSDSHAAYSGFSVCNSSLVYEAGNATGLGHGPGSVPTNNSYFGLALTAQTLVENVMVMAYDEWLTLRALTKNGTYPIPADCSIPTPSDAFPAATNFVTYGLSAADVEGVYLSYLNSVGRGYGSEYVNGFTNFCNDPNLGLTFNWSAQWHLLLNITASIYLGAPNGTGLYPNGTYDHNSTYANPASWPVKSVDPTLLYPYEYDLNVPVSKVVPIPINDPIAGLLVNWSQNPGYGIGNKTPLWGTPTYLNLIGNGNYTEISGNNSHEMSGYNVTEGDAVYVSSCVLNNVTQSICPLSATYFNNFSFGVVHFILSALFVPPIQSGFLGLGACDAGGLQSSILTAWMGDVVIGVANALAPLYGVPVLGPIFKDLGCFLGWLVVIIIVLFLLWVVYKIVVGVLGRGPRSGGNRSSSGTLNVVVRGAK